MNYLSGAMSRSKLAPARVSSNLEPTVRRHKPDLLLLVFVILLLMLGLIVIYSISPALAVKNGTDQNHFMYRQIAYMLIAGVAFAATSKTPIKFWAKIQSWVVATATLSCLALLALGSTAYGATRWLKFGSISFQPAELVKFALVLYLARLFTERLRVGELNDKRATLYPFGITLAVVGVAVAVLQKDLGTMIAVVILMVTMAYYAGFSKKNLMYVVAGLVVAGTLSIAVFPHRVGRITTFLHPNKNKDSSSYQIDQALIAVGSGGLTGKGIGRSVQAYGYLPEAENDSVFAIMSEKFGFIGTTVVIGLFGALLWRMIRIVQYSSSIYTQLLAAGVFGWVMAHIIVNIAAILGLMPLTGITLPFISFGGTSLIFIMASLGIVFNISRYTYHELSDVKEAQDAYTTRGGRIRRSRHSAIGSSWRTRSA